VEEIPGVIHLLTQAPPSIQLETIETYFTPDASFIHPFCRTGNWSHSLWLMAGIYRWYKIMSPRIDLQVKSVAFDQSNLILYVQIFQVFRIWFIPFYCAPVDLTTVIQLRRNDGDDKYYIYEQNDLYQVDQFVKFLVPGSWVLVYAWQIGASVFCLVGAWVLRPVTWVEEWWGWGVGNNEALEGQRRLETKEWKWLDGGKGEVTGRSSSFLEGSQSTSRHRTPSLDDSPSQHHHERLNRPRPSRTGSHDNPSPQSASPPCVDEHSGSSSKKTKPSRNTLKKAPRRDSLHTDTPSHSQVGQYAGPEGTPTFVPRLGLIRERSPGKESRSRAGSTVSPSTEPRTRRRRRAQDHAVERPQIRHKHGTLQRHAASLAQLPNPSLYSSEDGPHGHPPSITASSSASSSDDSEHDDTQSSQTGSSQFTPDTPTASPASTRMSNPRPRTRKHRNVARPLYASSLTHGHSGNDDDDEEEEEEEEDGVEEEEEEVSDEGSDEDEDDDEDETHDLENGHAPHRPIEHTPPSRVSSTSSSLHHDPHMRRLRQQERELANYVLQSPQPQKEFQFAGGPSPHPQQAMPMYSPRALSEATPASMESTSGYPPEWPPFPPALPIEYSAQAPLGSPTTGRAYPLTVQPPMGAPPMTMLQHSPPFPPHRGQPPQYQAPFPAFDVTRTTAAGYELLANKLSESPNKGSNALRKAGGKVVPMYRKFEHLNHRVLLHLQDEICELEEELRYLDEGIIQMSPKDEAGHTYPASRRGDARFGSEMHFKRTELLGRIFLKLGQYNQALTSFNSLLKELDPAGADDIQAYRAWMEKRAPIDHAEARFLERKHDLVAVSQKTRVSARENEEPHQPEAMWLLVLLLVPLLAFSIVPSLFGRLVVITLIGAAKVQLVRSSAELMSYMSIQQWTVAASA
ncbi:hypothetical protein GQ44DRAFT_617971, partial [Phaeosphaeriaceae sp. PMI808]